MRRSSNKHQAPPVVRFSKKVSQFDYELVGPLEHSTIEKILGNRKTGRTSLPNKSMSAFEAASGRTEDLFGRIAALESKLKHVKKECEGIRRENELMRAKVSSVCEGLARSGRGLGTFFALAAAACPWIILEVTRTAIHGVPLILGVTVTVLAGLSLLSIWLGWNRGWKTVAAIAWVAGLIGFVLNIANVLSAK